MFHTHPNSNRRHITSTHLHSNLRPILPLSSNHIPILPHSSNHRLIPHNSSHPLQDKPAGDLPRIEVDVPKPQKGSARIHVR